MQQPRQGGYQRVEGAQVAAEEAADQNAVGVLHRQGRAGLQDAPVERDGYGFWLVPAREDPLRLDALGLEAGDAGHHVGVAVREHEDVARLQPHRLEPLQGRPAAAAGHHMELYHVLGPGHHRLGDLMRRRGLGRPVCLVAHIVEDRSAQAHRA